jgi:hypothetical protein
MRGDNIPYSVYLERLVIENDALAVRYRGDAGGESASGRCRRPYAFVASVDIENPEP